MKACSVVVVRGMVTIVSPRMVEGRVVRVASREQVVEEVQQGAGGSYSVTGEEVQQAAGGSVIGEEVLPLAGGTSSVAEITCFV